MTELEEDCLAHYLIANSNYILYTKKVNSLNKKLEELKTVTLPELQRIAEESKEQTDAQVVNDMVATINRFEKRIYDLKKYNSDYIINKPSDILSIIKYSIIYFKL